MCFHQAPTPSLQAANTRSLNAEHPSTTLQADGPMPTPRPSPSQATTLPAPPFSPGPAGGPRAAAHHTPRPDQLRYPELLLRRRRGLQPLFPPPAAQRRLLLASHPTSGCAQCAVSQGCRWQHKAAAHLSHPHPAHQAMQFEPPPPSPPLLSLYTRMALLRPLHHNKDPQVPLGLCPQHPPRFGHRHHRSWCWHCSLREWGGRA